MLNKVEKYVQQNQIKEIRRNFPKYKMLFFTKMSFIMKSVTVYDGKSRKKLNAI